LIASVGCILCAKSGTDCNWSDQIDYLTETRAHKSLLLLRHRIDQVNWTGLISSCFAALD